jgi:hypothetical protein
MAHHRSRLVGLDKLTDAEVSRMLELFEDPTRAVFSLISVSAWVAPCFRDFLVLEIFWRGE